MVGIPDYRSRSVWVFDIHVISFETWWRVCVGSDDLFVMSLRAVIPIDLLARANAEDVCIRREDWKVDWTATSVLVVVDPALVPLPP